MKRIAFAALIVLAVCSAAADTQDFKPLRYAGVSEDSSVMSSGTTPRAEEDASADEMREHYHPNPPARADMSSSFLLERGWKLW